MRAAVLVEYGQPLELRDLPVPTGPGVLVKVTAAGICATDLKCIAGANPDLQLPSVLGHEVAGKVVADSTVLRRGTEVAVQISAGCGTCRHCAGGRETVCHQARRLGFDIGGGFAEYVRVAEQQLVPLPSGMDPAVAAVSMDSVLTPWRALTAHRQLSAGSTVLVVGAGGLGLNALQIAMSLGAWTVAADPHPDSRQAARSAGAEVVVDPNDKSLAGGYDADLAVECSGTVAGLAFAVEQVRPGGAVVCCGYTAEGTAPVDIASIVRREIQILGSRGGTREEAEMALSAVAEGVVRPVIQRRGGLADLNRFLTELRDGRVSGRQVIHP